MAKSNLIIEVETDGFITFITPFGDIDLSKSSELRLAIKPILEKDPFKVIVDLNGVPYMDSSGVATLVEALQLSKQSNIQFVVCCLTDGVRSIIELARLDKIFTICNSREEAIAK
ncbi:MAG: STAS domain-containing protein [Phycisphaerales bacterium]|jgi:anti-sigma B factor antagonist|nr:STAS domain-containing protein [Phycisphaerales bacterium]